MQTFDVTKKYNKEDFTNFLSDFLPDDFEQNEEELYADFKNIKTGFRLGECKSLDLTIFEFSVVSANDPRVTLTREVCALMKKYESNSNALAVFYNTENSQWRFSLITTDYETDKKGNNKPLYSNPKRFSFALGEGCKRHTPESMLFEKGTVKATKDKTALDDLKSRFAIEVVTKEFYSELFAWYEWACSVATYPVGKGDKVEQVAKNNETNIIRLITRLMFVWFIKQKSLIPEWIFNESELKNVLVDFDKESLKKGNYYNAVLQNLFFATLNKAINEREFTDNDNAAKHYGIKTLYRDDTEKSFFKVDHKKIIEIFKSVPFLNGGLFECLDKLEDKQIYNDGFSREKNRRAFLPNALFFGEEKDGHEGIVHILNRYNFMVEENSPVDIQVALDPELLGKVFENLLGTYNPETKETARKDSGSFYTPREIVNYMVKISLEKYLLQKIPSLKQEKVELLFSSDETNVAFDDSEKITNCLMNVKVFDPACGSGAFPMGILQALVLAIKKLNSDKYKTNKDLYNLKLHIIENCIYGSDIQSIAIQIAKLRFFISLICEQDKTEDANKNYGFDPLPNLETKFVSANSLIGIKKAENQGNLFENPEIQIIKEKLTVIRQNHFKAKTLQEKKSLREDDKALRDQLIQMLQEDKYFAPEDARQIASWNPYNQNDVSSFFDTEWMFGIKDGFDIVIGNPPYVQLQKDGGKLATMYENCEFKSFAKTGDIYCLFYEKAHQLLGQNGHLCFITSNKWMRAGYGEKLRAFFASNVNPEVLIDFAGVKIFESATVDTNIMLYCKAKNKGKTLSCVTKGLTQDGRDKLSDFIKQNSSVCKFDNSDSWVILSPIEQSIKNKIEAVGTPLKDWDISINYGIKTGYNDAFIISTETRNEILAACKTADEKKRTEELIRPILRGRDIKKYGYDWAGLWLINSHNGIKEKNIPRVDINEYPAVKQHLDKHWDKLEKRADKGDTPYNLRNCAYMDDFNKPKLMYSEIVQEPRFYLDKSGFFFPEATTFIMTGENLEYLYNLFHSNTITYFFKKFYAGGGLGENGYRYKKAFFENLPIPKYINTDLQNQIKTAKPTDDIEQLICRLYGFTNEECMSISM